MTARRPMIGITPDIVGDRYRVARSYAAMIERAGGVPVVLPCRVACLPDYIERCDGFVLSGGDDPDMRQWGEPLHAEATPIDPERQAFEWALLEALALSTGHAVLGVCLGMQMMAIHAGGRLDQHLPDHVPTAADHWGQRVHAVTGSLGDGAVLSHHRQAITDPGSLDVVAVAPDGIIEAVRSTSRPFYLGVQWHPERTEHDTLGFSILAGLVEAAAAHRPG